MLGQQTLRRVDEGFAQAVDAAVIGWDQSFFLRDGGGCSEAGYACGGGESGGGQFAAGDIGHVRSMGALTRPVIIDWVRLQNPARPIMTTWMSRNSSRARVTKKWMVRADCWP